ncbi:MAG: linear amide C-N hydrolase [Deltaproteobacteria bacterium]|nr:linear amide C-N hydrolase [Deltaproteobacteria bacterium]
MTRTNRLVLSCVTLLGCTAALPPAVAEACTAFAVRNSQGVFVGKSYDWHTGDGVVLQNPAGLRKRAPLFRTNVSAHEWTARYASLTFNQHGQDLPLGGINERGLVIETLWLSTTRHPSLDSKRPTTNELSLVQYMLDSAATTAEALAAAKRVQVAVAAGRVHYLICDERYACATLEYLDGETVVHTGKTLAVPVLTNHPYAAAVEATRQRKHRLRRSSLGRFAEARRRVGSLGVIPAASAERWVFEALDAVMIHGYSRWQIFYDVAGRQVVVKTTDAPNHPLRIKLERSACQKGRRAVDLQGALIGLKGKPLAFGPKHNLTLLSRGLHSVGLPAQVAKSLAALSEATTRCN